MNIYLGTHVTNGTLIFIYDRGKDEMLFNEEEYGITPEYLEVLNHEHGSNFKLQTVDFRVVNGIAETAILKAVFIEWGAYDW